jgi:hypothetical protein
MYSTTGKLPAKGREHYHNPHPGHLNLSSMLMG